MGQKPQELRPPCGPGRKKRIEWMRQLCAHRGGSDYRTSALSETGPWLFCWNVKLHLLDLSFENLKRRFIESNGKSQWDERFEDRGRQELDRIGEELLRIGAEDASRSFTGGRDGRPDDDAYNTLWDGSGIEVRFSLMGRSGGWLVMTEFQGHALTTELDFRELDYKTIRGMSEIVWFVHRGVGRGRHIKLVEERCAYTLFANLVDLNGEGEQHENVFSA